MNLTVVFQLISLFLILGVGPIVVLAITLQKGTL